MRRRFRPLRGCVVAIAVVVDTFRIVSMHTISNAALRSTRLGIGVGLLFSLCGASLPATLSVSIEHLRNSRGLLRICLSPNPKTFLECETDPQATKLSVPAGEFVNVHIDDLRPGSYALSILHDENANGELDKFLFVPREGFGFSRNPPIRMGPPRPEEVEFTLAGGTSRQSVTMRYLL